jgi:hypothetical protein
MAKTFDYLINGGPLKYLMIYLYILRRFNTKTQRKEINEYLKQYGYLPIYTINKILDKNKKSETTTGGKFRKSKKTRKQKSKKTRKRKVRK